MPVHDPDTDAGAIRRELGEVVGTLKMTVATVDKLTESVDRLVERAAVRADLEALRTEVNAGLASAGNRITALQKWMWTSVGALGALSLLSKFVKLPSLTIGS